MGILVKVIDPVGVEAAGPALDAMHDVALLQQQLRQVAAVLARDAGDQGVFAVAHGCNSPLSSFAMSSFAWVPSSEIEDLLRLEWRSAC